MQEQLLEKIENNTLSKCKMTKQLLKKNSKHYQSHSIGTIIRKYSK